MKNVFTCAHKALYAKEIEEKISYVNELWGLWEANSLDFTSPDVPNAITEPGRPEKPDLVQPRDLAQRGLQTLEGRAAMIHSIAHIEFNAINLALDAVYRFRDMPEKFYGDWLKVAHEEAYHYKLLAKYLEKLGFDYGDFPAHNGLWEIAMETAYDPLARMALIPKVMEARGLDVAPGIREKFASVGDDRMVEILHIIEKDEIGHVAIGNHWYYKLCDQRGLDGLETFRALLKKHGLNKVKQPLALESRRKAGFSEQEIMFLKRLTEKE